MYNCPTIYIQFTNSLLTMQFIPLQTAQSLFEQVEETLENDALKPAERIPKYRIILEALINELTADVKRHFGGLHAKEAFIFGENSVPKEIQREISGVRKMGNKVLHENRDPSVSDDLNCFRALCRAIAHFGKTDIPTKLSQRYQNHKGSFAFETIGKPSPFHSFTAIVHDVYRSKTNGLTDLCILTCETDDFGTVELHCYDHRQDNALAADLSLIANVLQPYSTIFIEKFKQHADKKAQFNSTPASIIVLEPDYLMEAKDVSGCAQSNGDNEFIQLIGRFQSSTPNSAMLVGQVVGAMLDDLCTEGADFDFKKTFTRTMREQSFGMLSVANQGGNYNKTEIEAIYDNAGKQKPSVELGLQSYKGMKPTLEPTFISAKYGLQGRLDGLFENPNDANHKAVLELKSGKFPNTGLWRNDTAQTLCYDLLLESVYPNRRGQSAILYAKATPIQQPLRNVNEDRPFQKQGLMMLRNRIVANDLRLTEGDYNPILNLVPESVGNLPDFFKVISKTIGDWLNTASTLEKDYFLGFCSFIARELRMAKVGTSDPSDENFGFAGLWKLEVKEKKDRYSVLADLVIERIEANLRIHLKFSKETLFTTGVSNFRENDIVLLYPTPDQTKLEPLKYQILKGTIEKMSNDGLVLSLNNKQLDTTFFNQSTYWAIERDFRESSYKAQFRSLFEFVKTKQANRDLILGLKEPQFDALKPIDTEGFVGNQCEIVKRALSAKDYFLIQGPPGTGKTSQVLCEIVRNLTNEDVLIVAFTNRAVDEICQKLTKKGVIFMRLGRGTEGYCFQELAKRLPLNHLHERLMTTRVFVTTQTQMIGGSSDLLNLKNFSTVIVDEASQLLVPQVMGILTACERFILIGDEKQLPAVVLQNAAESACESLHLQGIGMDNFRESLFYNLLDNAKRKNWTHCFGMIDHHHRMHKDVAAFINTEFYGNQLQMGDPSVQQAKIAINPVSDDDFIGKLMQKSRVVFVPSKLDKASKINESEARSVVEWLRHLAEHYETWFGEPFDETRHIGIITPYRAQIAKIRQLLNGDFPNLRIDTVERFQGSECDIILMSFAVKNTQQLANLCAMTPDGKVDRKLNVALSRAKKHVVLTGCEAVLRQNPIFNKLLNHIEASLL
jgi:DNA replication ATP-dependent helicase Dna2